jgi:hypothetical protein
MNTASFSIISSEAGAGVSALQWGKYLAFVVFVSLIGFTGLLFWQLRIVGCSGYAYGPGIFLAQCSQENYGDYEHGALGLGLEKAAVDNLKRADVLVLGHSHAMVAFSTEPTRLFFENQHLRFFNASLSGEYSPYFDFLLKRLRPTPKVVIIDVAPFFTWNMQIMSPAGKFIVDHPVRASLEYTVKQLWQVVHRHACEHIGGFMGWICGTRFSTFRSAADGSLIADYSLAYGRPLPTNPVSSATHSAGENANAVYLAAQFFSRNHLDPNCTILTAVPTGGDFLDSARAIATALHAPLVRPDVDGLTMLDATHLNAASATTWSKAFWTEAEPTIARCTGQ